MRFFGQVDGIVGGEIYGWAYDAENPHRPIRVATFINDRRVAEMLAFYYRPDVAVRMQTSGQHGFYFALSRYSDCAKDAIVDLRFPNGELLEGTPLRVQVPGRDFCSCPTLLFMHIPKTAGTALREACAVNYMHSQLGYIYEDPPGLPLHCVRELPSEQLSNFRFMAGHFGFGVHEWLSRDCLYFAVVRNPLSRAWSHYNHLVQERNPAAVTSDGRVRSIEEMLGDQITVELDNLMVRYLAGVDPAAFPVGTVDREVFDLSIAHLNQAVPYVAFPEYLEDAYKYLRNRLGWRSTALPQMMNSGSYPIRQDPTPEEEKVLLHFNQWDLKLYEYICNRRQPAF